jgi:hypothetical protein
MGDGVKPPVCLGADMVIDEMREFPVDQERRETRQD